MSNPLVVSIQTLKFAKKKAVPWVDGDQLPWNNPDFSRRFAAKVDYTTLFNAPSTCTQVDMLQQELGLRAGDTIIDLCCGPGPHSIELAKRGLHVLGVDIGSSAIDIARERAADRHNGEPQFVVGDVCAASTWVNVTSLLGDRPVDAAFMIRAQIDNFTPLALSNLAGHLSTIVRPGGRILLEFTEPHAADKTCNRSWSVWDGETSIWADYDCLVLSDRRWDDDQQAVIERYWVLHPDGQIAEYATCQQCYERGYMTSILQEKGWEGVRFVPGDSDHTRVVATRPIR